MGVCAGGGWGGLQMSKQATINRKLSRPSEGYVWRWKARRRVQPLSCGSSARSGTWRVPSPARLWCVWPRLWAGWCAPAPASQSSASAAAPGSPPPGRTVASYSGGQTGTSHLRWRIQTWAFILLTKPAILSASDKKNKRLSGATLPAVNWAFPAAPSQEGKQALQVLCYCPINRPGGLHRGTQV